METICFIFFICVAFSIVPVSDVAAVTPPKTLLAVFVFAILFISCVEFSFVKSTFDNLLVVPDMLLIVAAAPVTAPTVPDIVAPRASLFNDSVSIY